jgi:hypothetical protein
LTRRGNTGGHCKTYRKSQKTENMWKLLQILANTKTTNGNQSPLHNKLLMANKKNSLFGSYLNEKWWRPPLLSNPFTFFKN